MFVKSGTGNRKRNNEKWNCYRHIFCCYSDGKITKCLNPKYVRREKMISFFFKKKKITEMESPTWMLSTKNVCTVGSSGKLPSYGCVDRKMVERADASAVFFVLLHVQIIRFEFWGNSLWQKTRRKVNFLSCAPGKEALFEWLLQGLYSSPKWACAFLRCRLEWARSRESTTLYFKMPSGKRRDFCHSLMAITGERFHLLPESMSFFFIRIRCRLGSDHKKLEIYRL